MSTKSYGMKWYKFLIYFYLPYMAISLGILSIICWSKMLFFNGHSIYGISGLAYGGVAVMALFVRNSLVLNRKSGPNLLYKFFILNCAANTLTISMPILLIMPFSIGSFDIEFGTIVGTIDIILPILFVLLMIGLCFIVPIPIIILNKIYFKKRKDMFKY